MRFLVLLLLFTGCSAKTISCKSSISDKKSILNETQRDVDCSCECPTCGNLVGVAGTVGGVLNLVGTEN